MYIIGFVSKFYALMSTSFTDVIFLDSDNLVVTPHLGRA